MEFPAVSPLNEEVKAMAQHFEYWRKGTVFALDCLAILAGALIAAPFVIVLATPFINGL